MHAQQYGFVSGSPMRRQNIPLAILGIVAGGFSALMLLGTIGVLVDGETPHVGTGIGMGVFFALVVLGSVLLVRWGLKMVPDDRPAQFAQAMQVRDQFLQHANTSDIASQRINAAADLMLRQDYHGALQAYAAIARDFPTDAGTAYGQMGAAYYFLGDYQTAIQYYQTAIQYGEDPSMMNDNIIEAQQALGMR